MILSVLLAWWKRQKTHHHKTVWSVHLRGVDRKLWVHKDGALAQLGIQEGLLEEVKLSCISKDE